MNACKHVFLMKVEDSNLSMKRGKVNGLKVHVTKINRLK